MEDGGGWGPTVHELWNRWTRRLHPLARQKPIAFDSVSTDYWPEAKPTCRGGEPRPGSRRPKPTWSDHQPIDASCTQLAITDPTIDRPSSATISADASCSMSLLRLSTLCCSVQPRPNFEIGELTSSEDQSHGPRLRERSHW